MKKNKIIKCFLAATMLASIAACSSDFLEVTPYGKSDASSYYSNDTETTYAVSAIYKFLQIDQFAGWSSPFFIKNLPGDDTNCGGGSSSDQSQYQNLDVFNWTADNAAITAFYKINYYGIERCNEVIKYCAASSDLQKRLVAEAKCLRAYYYLELTTVFGDVPLRIEPTSGLSSMMARTPQAQVYTQIIKDCDDAIAVLPNKSGYGSADKFRCSKQTAQTIKGKTQLFKGDYANSAATFETIIAKEGSEVGLGSDFSRITRSDTEFGIESILEASFVSNNYNWGNCPWDKTAVDNRHLQLWGPREFDGSYKGGKSLDDSINAGWGFNPPTRKLYNAFHSDEVIRKRWTVMDTSEFRLTYKRKFVEGWGTQGCLRTKYQTYFAETTSANGSTPELNYATNWRLLRYADVLLMAAEAYQKAGTNDARACALINKVRTRAGLAGISLTGTPLFNQIVYERQVELAYEGVRFWDLVRWGLADQELRSLGFVKGKHEHFPIPLDEINGNTAIGQANQNPGY